MYNEDQQQKERTIRSSVDPFSGASQHHQRTVDYEPKENDFSN